MQWQSAHTPSDTEFPFDYHSMDALLGSICDKIAARTTELAGIVEAELRAANGNSHDHGVRGEAAAEAHTMSIRELRNDVQVGGWRPALRLQVFCDRAHIS